MTLTEQTNFSTSRQIVSDEDLKKQELFNDVDIEPVMPLLKACPIREINKNEQLIGTGEANHQLYLILSGRFRVHLPNDMSNPVAVLEPGQSIGEISIIDQQPASASVVADEDASLLVIDEKTYWKLVEESHSIAYNMLVVLAQRLRYGNSVINHIKELLNEYEYNATIDPLTSLYNRRWLDNMLERVMHRCSTKNQPLSVLMVDIDFFKQFNDTHGHLAGDTALRVVSRSIVQNLRPEDLVARYGGEELFALLPGLDVDAAATIAERLRHAISEAEIRLSDGTKLPGLTVSIGIAEKQEGATAHQIIDAADQALYRAKHAGRNKVSQ